MPITVSPSGGGGGSSSLAQVLAVGNDANALAITNLANPTNPQDAVTLATLAAFAPLSSPAFTDSPTAPTQVTGDGSTKIATTAYADAAGSNAANALLTYSAALGDFIAAAGITPIADGVYPTSGTLGGSTTYMSGLAIANEEAS